MTTRRVIFPAPDTWTRNQTPKEQPMSNDPKQDAIRNCPDATMPEDAILTHADNLRVMVSAAPNRGLMLALHFTLPAPLGDVEVFLGREQFLELHDHLHDLLNLNDEQTDLLMARLHGDIQ